MFSLTSFTALVVANLSMLSSMDQKMVSLSLQLGGLWIVLGRMVSVMILYTYRMH